MRLKALVQAAAGAAAGALANSKNCQISAKKGFFVIEIISVTNQSVQLYLDLDAIPMIVQAINSGDSYYCDDQKYMAIKLLMATLDLIYSAGMGLGDREALFPRDSTKNDVPCQHAAARSTEEVEEIDLDLQLRKTTLGQ